MTLLERAILHNDTQAEREPARIRIVTPQAKWAYALETPLDDNGYEPFGPLRLTAHVDVVSGKAGVGCLSSLNEFIAEQFVEAPGGAIDILIPSGIRAKSLIVRNAAEDDRTDCTLRDVALEEYVAPASHEVTIDARALSKFKPWAGRAPAGFFMNWLGVKTRAHVWQFSPEVAAIYATDRDEQASVPFEGEHLLDYAPLLDAVVAAGDTFVMVALGCGWGRWLSGGAIAAQQVGKDYRLFGVEAEPVHFDWMREHFEDNGIDFSRATLVRAAASHHNGPSWFQIGNADSWYGQSILSDEQAPDAPKDAPLWSETEVNGIRLQRVESIDLRAIAAQLPIIDYVHMDIQGSEADFLEAHPDVLDARVRYVNVGTHSNEVEARLRTLFARLGWENMYDIPLRSTVLIRSAPDAEPLRVDFGDGVQVWRNPRLTAA